MKNISYIQKLRKLKKVLLLFSIIFIIHFYSHADDTIFSDTFSGSYPGSWYIGHDGGGGSYSWAWPDGYAHEYSNPSGGMYYYPDDLHVYMERRYVNLSGYSSASLTFYYVVDSEPEYDYFTVNVRDQSGNWHEMFRASGEHDLTWVSQAINLNQFAGQSGLYIQFRFDSDGSVSGEPYNGVYVDNVQLTAGSSGDIYEPDNSYSQATAQPHNACSLAHSIDPADDQDWVYFDLSSTSNIIINTSGPYGDTRMWLYNSSLNQIDYDDDDGDGNFSKIECLDANALSPGRYYVKIDEYGNNDIIPEYFIELSVETYNPPPIPDLVSVTNIPSSITLGNSFTMSVTAENDGGVSPAGYISISYTDNPTLTNETGSGLSFTQYPPGYYPIYDRFGNPITAQDKLLDAYDSNWTGNESHTMSVTVTPQQTGTMYIYVRTNLKDNDSENYYSDCSVTGGDGEDTDQQGWTCRRFSVNVDPVLTQTRFVGNDFVDKTATIGLPVLLRSRLQYYAYYLWWDLPDQTVHFEIYYSGSWHEISGSPLTTDGNGFTSMYYSPPQSLPPDDYPIRARYDSEGTYASCQLTRTLTLKKPTWLLMYYMCHGGDLDNGIFRKFETIAGNLPNDNIEVFMLNDILNSQDYVFRMKNDGNTNNYVDGAERWTPTQIGLSQNEFDTGDVNTLNIFTDFVTSRCDADYYALIIFNHGRGISPTVQVGIPKPEIKPTGVAFDSNNSYLSINELGQGVNYIKSKIGQNLSIFHLDACLMQMIEVNYEIKNSVDFFVASENEGWANNGLWGSSWETYLSGITSSTTPLNLAANMANVYFNWSSLVGYGRTISVTDIDDVESVKTAVDDLSEALINNLALGRSQVDLSRNNAQKFAYFDTNNTMTQSNIFLDLRDFCEELRDNVSANDVVSAANSVINLIDNPGSDFIRLESHANGNGATETSGYWFDRGTYGMSIFFPEAEIPTYLNYINDDDPIATPANLSFTADTLWDDFLKTYFDDDNPICSLTAPNSSGWFKGDIWVSATASDSTSDILYVLFEYSLTGNENDWHALPGPDSTDGRDWYGDNGWALTFRTTNTPQHGNINDGTVWVRARSMDKAGNLSNWDVCDYAIGVDNTPPDLSGVSGHTADPLPGTYTALQYIFDALSGVLDNNIYPRFYFRWNNNNVDSSNYDSVIVGSWNGSFYEANLEVSEDHIGDRIFWRVQGSDNVDNLGWSPVHDGGVIQSINFVTDTDSISIPEGGNATFQVKLSREPASTVNAFVAWVSGDADITVQSGSNLTFTTSNWNTYQTVTLAAAEDGDTVNSSATFRITALVIPDKPITAIESDNDTVNFETNTNWVTVPEGSTGTFQVRLTDAPTSTVNASVSWTSGDSDITVQSGSGLTFTTSNWNTYQTVTLAASEDVDVANGSATIRMSASGIPNKDITANEQDNDSLGFVTNTDSVTVAEGSTATFQVKLSHQPTSNISVFVTNVSGDSDITVQSGSSLTFTTSNWNTYQTVTLAALEDGDIDNGSATIRMSASGIPDKDITAFEQDNDTINFVTDTDSVTVPEGGTATFQVKLSAQPSSDVNASVSWFSGDSDIAVQSGSSLTFTSSNWNTYQTVTLFASEDGDITNDSSIIRLSASGVTDKDITAIEADNDTLSFETDTESVTVPEGSTATFQVRVSHQPSSDINAAVSWVGGDSDITVQSGASLPFTPSNWDTYQTVTLAAAEDADDTNGQATIRISAAGVPDKDITATEQDNDTEGISGRVIDSQGNGIQNVRVYVYDLDGYYISNTNTDSTGNYMVQLAAGSYLLFFDTWNAGNYIEEWYNDKSDFDSADPVTVTIGQVTSLADVVLTEGGIISGRVTDSQGNGIADVYIEVDDLNYDYLGGAYTDINGDYTIQCLPAGSCKVYFATWDAGNYISEWYNDKGWFDDADSVSVTTGQTTVVDAVLSEGGIIGGRVTDSQGNGIEYVYIEVNDLNYYYWGGGSTDSNGNYTIQGLPAGNCKVFFGSYNAGNYVDEWYNDKGSFDDADPVSVTTGQTTVVDAVLTEGGIISGRVIDGTNGIENAVVRVYDSDNNYMGNWWTDSNGDYTAEGLTAGSYKVHIDTWAAGNYVSEWYNDKGSFDDADIVSVTAGQATILADVVLAEGGIISSRVTDSQGNGIENVYVEVYDLNNNYLSDGSTDSNGDYNVQRLPAGECKVYFDAYSAGNYINEWYNDRDSFENADAVSVTAGQTTTLEDAVLAESGMISGRVTDGVNGIENVTVRIYDLDNNYIGNWWTDNNGDYTVQGLLPGSYKVHFDTWEAGNYISEWYNDRGSFEEADPVTVIAGQTTTLADAVLTQGGMISGRVTDSQGNGIENVYVEIYDLNHEYIKGGYSDSNGDYTIQSLLAGDCKVHFTTWDAGNYISEWYNDKGLFDDADPVSVTTGQTTVVDVVLTEGGMISGRVTDSQGNGIENVYVEIYDLNYDYMNSVYTDSNGDYTIQYLLAGNYKVNFETWDAGNYISEWYNDKNDFSVADQVSVTAGQTTTLTDVVLAEGGIISGRVTDGTNGIGDVHITLYDLNYNYVSSTDTDSSGNYVFSRLTTGSYKLRFFTTGNYIGEWYNDKDSYDNADIVPVTTGQTTTLADLVLAEGGSLNGRVTDSQGNGIENVDVYVYDLNSNNLNSGYTDSNGDYTIQAILPGDCKVHFGTYGAGNYVSEWYNDKGSFNDADIVPVTAGQTTTLADAVLAQGGMISGRVTDSQGNGIKNVYVNVYDMDYDYLNSGYSDSSGYYTVQGLPTANCKVYFGAYGAGNYLSEWYNDKGSFNDADIVSVTAGQTTNLADAMLEEWGSISGRVIDLQGNGIANVEIDVFDLNFDFQSSGYTDSNGNYIVNGLHAGDCKVHFNAWNMGGNYISEWYNDKGSFDDADVVSVTSGQTTGLADAVLAEGGIISGRVTDGANGIENVRLRVYDLDYSAVGSSVYTDSNGDYTVQCLAGGSYKVRFYAAGNFMGEWYNDKGDFNTADVVPVTEGQTTTLVDTVLAVGGIISGRVTDSQGNGIGDVDVYVYDLNGSYLSWGYSDSNGDYTVQAIPAGNCKIEFDPYYSGNYIAEWYNDKGSFDDADTVSVTVGQTTTLDDAVLAEGGMLSGRVTDGTNGIEDVRVRVYDLNYNSVGSSVYTDSNGDYTIHGIPGGNCKVRFNTTGNFVGEWYNDKDSFDNADTVSVTVGQTTTLTDAILAVGGIISGRVTDGSNGIDNVIVRIYDLNNNYYGNCWTDGNGDYTVQGIPTGNYKVEFYSNSENYIGEWYNDKSDFSSADPVSVTAGQTTNLADAVLAQGGIISGRVTDGSNGIDNVIVRIYDLNNNYYGNCWTDGNGDYTVQGLPAGNYKVNFDTWEAGNYVSEWYNDKSDFSSADSVSVTPGQTTNLSDAVLAQGGIISGRVTDSQGNGIGNVSVEVYDLNSDYLTSGNTDSNGDYTVQAIPAGNCKVYFEDYSAGNYLSEWYNDKYSFNDADQVAVTAGQTITLADAVLAEGGSISGRVTDGTNGIEGVHITLYDLNYDYISSTNTDSNGDYVISHLGPGSYKVKFYSIGNYIGEWYDNKSDFDTADAVVVTSGNITTGIDAVLTEGGSISGRVTDSQGNSVENVYVYIYDLNYNYLGSVYTDSSGDYTIQALPGGNYKVYFRGYTAGNYLSEWYNDKGSFDDADTVLVTAGQTTTLIDAVLADGGSINGRVSDDGDRAIEGVMVRAYDPGYNSINYTYTDSNGDYTIQAVPTGNCKVRFSTTGNYIGEWYNDKSDFDNADPVSVTAGQTTTGVDAVLESGGSIAGTVTDTSSNPVADLDIEVCDLYGNYLAWGDTDENGNYEVQGIREGSCKVLFDPWYLNNYPQYYGDHNYAHEWYNDKGTFNDADIVPVSVNQVTPGIDAVLSEGGTITGEITDEYANAVENITIIALKDNTQNLMHYYRGESDSNGVYEVKGLPTGDYLVIFRAGQDYSGQFYNDVLFESDAALVSVTLGSETSGINAVLKKAAVVSGRVTETNGNGIEDVNVRLYDSVRNEYLGWIGNYARTDNDGYYTISSAAPGERKVMFETSSVESGNVVSEFYNDKQSINNADILTIQSEGTYPDIDAVLSSGGGTLSGYVKNSSGIALDGVNVEIYNTQYQAVMGGTGTDSNGYFEVRGLIPGQYKVFTGLYHIYTSEWYSDKTTFESADAVTVTDGGNTQIHVLLGGSDPGSINITSPNGGESLVVGSRHEITWDSTETGNVIIEYSKNGGASWKIIVPLTPNDGSYYWTVPGTPSENCLIRISGSDSDEAPSDISDTVFSIVLSLPSTITVTSPNGGESLIAGSTHNITWTTTGPYDIENVIIEYSTNSGVSWENIVPYTANTGNHNWTVPDNPSENCLIRISGSDSDLGPSDVSDAEFSIVLPSSATVTITSPNGGEKLEVGSIYNITWTSTGTDDIDNVKIEYSIDSGTSWTEIVTSTANNGSYSWTVPDTPSENCLIRVSDTDGDPSDVSDAVFSIVLPPSITITSPNGGESWETGSTQSITWSINGTNSVGNLKIEYSIDNNSSWTDIDTSAANTGSYDWLVPDNPSDNCRVRLSGSDSDRTISDISDALFSIVPAPFITVTSPNGGESLEVGSTHDITWTSSGTQGDVKIEYSIDNGAAWTTIVTSTTDDGSHSWTVPDDLSDNCLVRIGETDGEPSDVSEGVFFIVSPTTVSVTSPNGGESLTVGSTYEITWTSTGMGDNEDVIIEYSADNDATWTNIVPSTANNGRYIWTVPDNPSDNCLIRIRADDSDDGPSDVSDTVFSIVPAPFITVTSPNGGESLNVDSIHEITWATTGTDDVENITIDYSTDSGTSWTNIVVSTENDGSYDWTVPDDPSENCLVRVSGGDSDEGPSDVSDEVFFIIPAPIITVTSPNGGEQWLTGSTYNITWTSSNVTGDVNIYLYAGESFDLNIGTASAGSGTFEWTVPGTFTVGDDYKVLVFQDSIEDYSDESFSIMEMGPNNPDFNNDGKVDILWRNYVTGANEVWYMDEAAHISTASLLVMSDLYWRIVGTGDFNQDGKVDILWRRYTDGKNLVWYMDGAARTGEAYLLDQPDSNWQIVGTGDFNGDAKVDILWRNAVEARNMVWYMDGVTRIGIRALPKIEGQSWQIAGTGDFNGDNKVDILWRNDESGSNQVWYMDGPTFIGTAGLIQETDLDWRIVGTGDFNLDGELDILWRRYSDGQNMIWYMAGVVRTGYEYIETRSDLNWRIVNNGD